jgi:D-glycero-alpha-D-manno-heptose-7-phosphate kinase
MIITKTPFRISLFGGGTDYPAWYRDNGGEVISFAIDKYCYLSTRVLPPFFDYKYRIAYSKVEMTKSIDEIQHPAVREGIRKYCPDLALEIHHDGDLPARSGVGSSSAFAVGLIKALTLLQKLELSKEELAYQAIELEQEILKENVGSQDQIACAIGGMNYIKFGGEKEWVSEKLNLSAPLKDELERRVVLIYSGIHRSSSDVQANLLTDLNRKTKVMIRTTELARECNLVLQNGKNLDLIGDMLNESWGLKKAMNTHAITSELEVLWQKSKSAGAIGGKVLGAGGGGFCMFWVKDGDREKFIKELNFGTYVPVKISEEGSTLILR